MQKTYLFTPGPTPVPPEVLAAMAEPMVHHRGSDFREVYERCLTRLQEVYRTKGQVLLFAASGTGAMESAVANLCQPGQRVAVVTAGAFGDRWAAICDQYGLEVERIAYEWGEVPVPEEIASAARDVSADVVFCTQSETSTGVVADVQGIKAAPCRSRRTPGGSTSFSPVRRRR
jgi:aspartate aminotransferase-like enzyme